MAQPERPNFVPQTELELVQPRTGIKMAVVLHDRQGIPLQPGDNPKTLPEICAKLSIGTTDPIYERRYVPEPDTDDALQPVLTVYTFILGGHYEGLDPRYERDLNLFVAEQSESLDNGSNRSITLDAAQMADETIFPDQIKNPNVHQFLLTREFDQNRFAS